jgi:glutaredoxin
MWIAIPAIALVFGFTKSWTAAVLVLLVGVLFEVGYIRNFQHVSGWLGYGSVDDVRSPRHISTGGSIPRVTLYTAAGCPFCPIVRERLEQLRQELWFDLDEQDVTFRSQKLRARGIRSIPVVEVGSRVLVGNATSDALAAFLTDGSVSLDAAKAS